MIINNEVKKKANKYRKIAISQIIICAISVLTLFMCIIINEIDIAIGSAFIFVASLICFFVYKERYAKTIKNETIYKIICEEFDNVSFSIDAEIDADFVEKTELQPTGTNVSSNDLVKGTYKGVNFSKTDVKITRTTYTGKTTITTTLFQGPWIVYDFNKDFNYRVQIRSKAFLENEKPFSLFTTDKLKKIELDYPEFNEMYNVYTEDGHESFYLLSLPFMERLIMLKNEIKDNIAIGFIDNQMHITIDNEEDSFEPSLLEEINDDYVKKIHRDCQIIKDVVDILKIDERIFK